MNSFIPISVVVLFIGFSLPLLAQDSLFAYVNSRNSRAAIRTVDSYKYETAKRLYEQLIQARGDRRKLPPKFIMNQGERYVAWMNPFQNEIGLEETAYDVCTQMGADSLNAMAALLAHEITHYYENHDWSRSFVRSNKELSVSDKIEALDEALKFEVQADYLGGILAISAGYNTYGVFDKFLKAAYEAYDLPEAIEGYPDLEERLKMSAITADRLQKLHSVYQVANLLVLLEAHGTAEQYYGYILSDFQSYEVYNNAGVNACLAALQLLSPKDIPFVLPLELDLSSRLEGLSTRAVDDQEKRKVELLKIADGYFKNAIEMAPDQPAAYLNLSIVYTLQSEWLDADLMARKARALSQRSSQPKPAADAQIVLGILAALQKDADEARRLFTLALSGNPALAKINLANLDGGFPQPMTLSEPARGVEQIEGIVLEDVLADPQFTVTVELSDDIICGKQVLDQSELLIHYAQDGAKYTLFHQTLPGYDGTTQKGIRMGSQESDIQRLYGKPAKTIELAGGRCLIYTEQKLIFRLDENRQVEQWMVYATQQ